MLIEPDVGDGAESAHVCIGGTRAHVGEVAIAATRMH